MKRFTCAGMGGPCDTEVSGESAPEVMANGWKHMEEAHPEMAATMAALPQEQKDAWRKDFEAAWDATSDS